MAFKFIPIPSRARRPKLYKEGKAKYVNNEWFIDIGDKTYPITYDISKYTTFYSLPSNNQYEEWTKKVVKTIKHPNIVALSWSPFKPGLKIQGKIINNLFYEKLSL